LPTGLYQKILKINHPVTYEQAVETSSHRLPTTIHSHEGMTEGPSRRVHIIKTTRMGTAMATDRSECHGYFGWKIMWKGHRK